MSVISTSRAEIEAANDERIIWPMLDSMLHKTKDGVIKESDFVPILCTKICEKLLINFVELDIESCSQRNSKLREACIGQVDYYLGEVALFWELGRWEGVEAASVIPTNGPAVGARPNIAFAA